MNVTIATARARSVAEAPQWLVDLLESLAEAMDQPTNLAGLETHLEAKIGGFNRF